MDYYTMLMARYENTRVGKVFSYVYNLFHDLPGFSIGYNSKTNQYYFSLYTSMILMAYKNRQNELCIYIFGAEVSYKNIDYSIRRNIDDIYFKIKTMYLGLSSPKLNGYCFKKLFIYKSKSEFLGEPKLDNLFYFQEYVPKRSIDKANNAQEYTSFLIKWFKDRDGDLCEELVGEIEFQLRYLDKSNEYYVCSIPGHMKTIEATRNSFDIGMERVKLPENCIYLKHLILRDTTVLKKAFGHHTMWDEEVKSLSINYEFISKIYGKTVIVHDDITTTGCSMQAAKFLLLLAKKKNIIFIAYAKTTHI